MFDKFQQGITSANQAQAPASPLGDFPELRGYFKGAYQNAAGGAAFNALGNTASIMDSNNKKAAEAARAKKIDELSQKAELLKDMQDPNKYQKVLKDDGGFDYYAPDGSRISLQQYSQVTGKQPSKVLADSQNNLDRQYLEDHDTLEKLINFQANNDGKGYKKFLDDHPELAKSVKGLTADDLVNQFKQYYPNVYGNPQDVNATQRGSVRDISQSLYHQPDQQQGGNGLWDRLRHSLGGLASGAVSKLLGN